MRTTVKYTIKNQLQFKTQLLSWGSQFDVAVWLDSNDHTQSYSEYDAVLAVQVHSQLKMKYNNAFKALKAYQNKIKDWLFGYLTYDLKNDKENLKSENFDGLEFPELFFFQPKKIFLLKGSTVTIKYVASVKHEIETDLDCILEGYSCYTQLDYQASKEVKIKLRMSKDMYFNHLNILLKHIHRGDIYEANFCQEFYSEGVQINPLETYKHLNAISKPPFAVFFKMESQYLLSASPERYLKKTGQNILSQPIKGTAKRSLNAYEDLFLKTTLEKDEKERSENIMIVDLVRNDLSITAKKGSVSVNELCKVYTFDQVHQMISTVVSTVSKTQNPIDVIETTFPMGSMTGAPKISAMQLIEDLENTKRGLYSGAVGYITPEGDFDFNVVIRSILYNAKKQYVSFSVGGAITAKSNPEKEYEECLVKAKAMRAVLER